MKFNDVEQNAYQSVKILLDQANIRYNKSMLKNNLAYHSDFPSLIAISDILSELNVTNISIRIGLDQLPMIPLPAIVHITDDAEKFVVIRSINSEYVEYYTSDKNLEYKKEQIYIFAQKWNGVALLIEPTSDSGEKNYVANRKKEIFETLKLPIFVVGSLTILYNLFKIKTNQYPVFNNTYYYELMFIKLIGVVTTFLLASYIFNQDNSILRKVCSINKKTNCSSVLTSNQSKPFFFITWAEIGFFYYLGTFSFMLFSNNITLVFVLITLTIPYTFWSIYTQFFVIKELCTLCIIVQLLIWIELFMSLRMSTALDLKLLGTDLNILVMCMLAAPLIWLILRTSIENSFQFESINRSLQKLKYNPGYLNFIAKEKKTMPPLFDGMKVIKFGNPSAEYTVRIVASPSCPSCADHFKQTTELTLKESNLRCEVIIAANPSGHETADIVARTVLNLNNNLSMVEALSDWFAKPNLKKWQTKYPNIDNNYPCVPLEMSVRWLNLANITHAPKVFLNEIEYPNIYSMSEVNKVCKNFQLMDLQIN